MWVATWFLCVIGMGCQQINEPQPTTFFKESDCLLYAEYKAQLAIDNLKKQGLVAEIATTCEESKKEKQG